MTRADLPISPDRAVGLLLVATTVAVGTAEWTGSDLARGIGGVGALMVLAVLVPGATGARRIFLGLGAGLAAWAALALPDPVSAFGDALASAAFIAAFFSALTTLRHASGGSRAIQTCGRFLAQQPPGRRYLALTVGGHLFALLLNYGALALLGGLAEAHARTEPDPEIRRHRLRRMLLAIQRGFISTLPWSPFAFAVAISLTVVPEARWTEIAGPCFVTGLLLAGLGWGLDTLFKPRLSRPPPPRTAPEGSWASLWPLLLLLALLVVGVGGLHVLTEVRAVGVAMLFVPLVALVWVGVQGGPTALRRRGWGYVAHDLPGYRAELVLLMMAGFIGTLGARLLAPMVEASGIDLAALPAWAVLVAVVWLIPLAGQVGMNPILSVSLAAPLIPAPETLGVSATAEVLAITAGWALSGANSPFTATTMLIGSMGGVSATHVGIRWNGLYTLIAAVVLSGWVALYAQFS